MTINRYIFKELWSPFLLGLFVLTFIFLLDQILKLAEMIINKGLGLGEVLLLIWYMLPSFLVLVIPSTVLLASLLCFGRLAADGEITALSASGVSFYQMLKPVVVFALMAYGITAYLAMETVPQTNMNFKRMVYNAARSAAAFEIQERVFIRELSQFVIYADQVSTSGDTLKGVLIADNSGSQPYLIIARSGKLITNPQRMNVILQLEGGTIHQSLSPQRFRQIEFRHYELNIDPSSMLGTKKPKVKEREMTFSQLRDTIKSRRQAGGDYQSFELEFHKRLALPLAALLVCFVGAPLGTRSRSASASAGLAWSLLIIFWYYIMLRTGETLGKNSGVPPMLAMWLPNMFLAAAGGYLVYKTGHNARIKSIDWVTEFVSRIWQRIKK